MRIVWLFLSIPLYAAIDVTTVTVGVESVISQDSGNFLPQIALNATGSGVAVWTQSTTTYSLIPGTQPATSLVASLYDATTQKWQTIPTTIGNGASPKVGIDGDGNAFVVYVFNSQIQVIQYDVSKGLWSTVPVALTTTNTNFTPSIVVSESGVAAVTWIANSVTLGTPVIQMAAYDGQTWSSTTTVTTADIGDFVSTPQIAIDNSDITTTPVQGQLIWQGASQTTQTAGLITTVPITITSSS